MGSVVIIFGVVSLQSASGTLWWAFARRGRSMSCLEAIGMGLALGTFASMLSAMVLAGTALDAVAWALPALVTAAVVTIAAMTHRLRLATPTVDRWQVLAVGAGLVAGVILLIANWVRIPLDDPGAVSYTDLYFFEAISRGLAEFGPSQSILMTDGSMRYHWFTYAWAGELAQTSSAAAFVTVTRVLPLVALIGVSLLAASWAGRLSRIRWVPTLAVLLVVSGGYVGALYGSILNFDSPSQSLTTLWLLALALAFVLLVEGLLSRLAGIATVAALAAACTGGKISHAAVAAGGIAMVVIVGLVTRAAWWRRAALAASVTGALMVATYVWVLAGVAVDRNLTEGLAVKASTWQGLDPLVGQLGVALGTAALVLAVLARVAGLGWLLALRRTRVLPDTLFATGALLAGLAAMLLLREGVNELWFVLAASAPAAVLSAVGVGYALPPLRKRPGSLTHPLLWAIAITVPATVTCLGLSANWSDHRALLNWLAPLSVWVLVPATALLVSGWRRPGGRMLVPFLALAASALVLVSITTRPASIWTSSRPITTERGEVVPVPGLAGEVAGTLATTPAITTAHASVSDAAGWLAGHSGPNDIVATTAPWSALVPALTGRAMFLSGYLYQVGLGRADELPLIEQRRATSQGLATGLTPRATAELCDAEVRWLWFEGAPEAAAALGLPVGYASEAVSVLRLPAVFCAAG